MANVLILTSNVTRDVMSCILEKIE